MKYCPRCGNLIEGSFNCIECGYKIKQDKLNENLKKIKVINNQKWNKSIVNVDCDTYSQIIKNCVFKIPSRYEE